MAEAMPADRVIERQVDAEIENGVALPRWGWPTPGSYNGATGTERVIGWQKLMIAERMGLVTRRGPCSACHRKPAEQLHTEIYFRPLASMAVCRSCHALIHRRFYAPERWQSFLDARDYADGWVASLLTMELERHVAAKIASTGDIFAALRHL